MGQIFKKQNQSSMCCMHKEPGAAAQTAIPTLRRRRQEEHKFRNNPSSLSKTLSPRMEEKREFSHYSWDYYSMKKAFSEVEILPDCALWGYQAWPREAASLCGQHGWHCILPPSWVCSWSLFRPFKECPWVLLQISTNHRGYFLSAPQLSVSHPKATQCPNPHLRHCNSVLATSTAYLGPREPVILLSSISIIVYQA